MTMTATQQSNGAQQATGSTAITIGSDAYRGALEPTHASEAFKFAELMASGGQWGSAPEIMGKIALGRTIGLPWMVSLQKIHLIKGSFAVAADTLHALCLRARGICEYFEPVLSECDATKATFVTKRVGRPEQRYTYTIEDAELMGVVDRGKDESAKKDNNWNKVRRQMLLARCKSILARLIYPDLVQGLYSVEELSGAGGFTPTDPNELTAEVLTPAEAAADAAAGRVTTVQAAARNYAAEADALKERIRAAGASRAARAEVRDAIAKWDGVDPWRKDVADFYNAMSPKRSTAAQAETTAAPAQVPDGNMFTGETEGQ